MIGGAKGWYYGSWMWKIRGFMDKLVGGVGLRRGRTHPMHLDNGDALDFWRVLVANRGRKRLLLYAEMRLPGEAWLEFRIDEKNNLHQIATFRPKGLLGRLYWYSLVPFHFFIFGGIIQTSSKSTFKTQKNQILKFRIWFFIFIINGFNLCFWQENFSHHATGTSTTASFNGV